MDEVIEIVRHARVENLPELLEFVDRSCNESPLGPSESYAMKLAVEEVCMNLIDHGYEPGENGEIEMRAMVGPDRLTMEIRDRARAFDPANAPSPDLDANWEDRRIGGLGWYLIKEMMDEIHYESEDGQNRLTLVKVVAPQTGHGDGS